MTKTAICFRESERFTKSGKKGQKPNKLQKENKWKYGKPEKIRYLFVITSAHKRKAKNETLRKVMRNENNNDQKSKKMNLKKPYVLKGLEKWKQAMVWCLHYLIISSTWKL